MTQHSKENGNNVTTKIFDEKTDKRIHEHLSNEKDEISEDDIRNIRTTIEEGEEVHQDPENPIIENPEHKKIKDDLNPNVDNSSWDILDS